MDLLRDFLCRRAVDVDPRPFFGIEYLWQSSPAGFAMRAKVRIPKDSQPVPLVCSLGQKKLLEKVGDGIPSPSRKCRIIDWLVGDRVGLEERSLPLTVLVCG